MRELDVAVLTTAIAEMVMDANYNLGLDVYQALEDALSKEQSPSGRHVLAQLVKNADIAKTEQVPMCQDTGFAVIYVELGQDIHLVGGDVSEAIQAGVRQGYQQGYLRNSIVADPLRRVNTNDNTPAVIHFTVVTGEQVKLIVAPKGGGSENVSAIKMLKPADGVAGVMDFVVETVQKAGSNPCPPMIIGVGIGGTFEKVTAVAKQALLRELGQPHADEFYAELEQKLLHRINQLGIGPQGFGGNTTALAVHIETFATHIASLPVAVNINCHAARHFERIL
ncbi:MAG: fumarate hydratase [Firmicutes bacterium]|nr:fumarate hydratase [Bacillota bacterium]